MTPKNRAQRETSAGGVVFRRSAEGGIRYLLIRDSYKNWGFPKGHLELGEAPEQAAKREVEEETGLAALTRCEPIDVIDWFFRFRGKTIHKYCYFFLFESASGETRPQREEGITACRWETYEQARTMITYVNAREILERAEQIVAAMDAEGARA